jgi:hypothetical protein
MSAEPAALRVVQGLLCCCNLLTAVLLGLLLATVIILQEVDISSTDSIEDDDTIDSDLAPIAITLGVFTAAGVVFAATACVRSVPVVVSSIVYSVIVTAGGVALLIVVRSPMVILLLPPVFCIALGASHLSALRRGRSAVEETSENPANDSIPDCGSDEDNSVVTSYHGERLLSPV